MPEGLDTGDGLPVDARDLVSHLEDPTGRRVRDHLLHGDRLGERVPQLVECRGDRVLLGVDHQGRVLGVGLIGAGSGREDHVDREHRLARREPGGDDVEPTRPLVRVAHDGDGEEIQGAGGRVRLLARDADQRLRARTRGGAHRLILAQRVEDRSGLLDHIRGGRHGQDEGERDGDRDGDPADDGAPGRSDFHSRRLLRLECVVGEEAHAPSPFLVFATGAHPDPRA